MLKKENAPSSTPKPTNKPTQQPVQTPYVPEPTQEAVTYYNVSCSYCVFSGGGYSGATSGSVPAGTSITVTTTHSSQDTVYWTGSHPTPYKESAERSFTHTVNADCDFVCNIIVN